LPPHDADAKLVLRMTTEPSSVGARTPILDRVELGCGVLLVLLLGYAHWEVLRNTGALWRDEVSSVNVATLPTFGEMLRNHHWDSFPVLWCVVLRGWIALGFGDGDAGLRMLGFVIGLVLVAELWWLARIVRANVPLVSLAVFAACPTVFRYGDAVRGYGLGVLLLLAAFGALWRLVDAPSTRRGVIALAATLLAVQSLFTNSALLLAIGLAGTAVAARRRDRRALLWLVAIGAVSVASMLPYLRVFAIHSEWSMIVRLPFDAERLVEQFGVAVNSAGAFGLWVWLAFGATSLVVLANTAFRKSASEPDRALALFVAVTLVASVACFVGYIAALGVTTHPWYYLPLLALAAVGFDAGVGLLARTQRVARSLRLVAVAALAVATVPEARATLPLRATTMDAIAAELEARATKDDLIVVHPWYAGITFARYYDGVAPWMIVPDLDTRLFQPYGAFKRRMAETNPIERELERIAATLRAGGRVWLAGEPRFVEPGRQPGSLPPAPHGPRGWYEAAYSDLWSTQTAYLLQTSARDLRPVPLAVRAPTLWYEDFTLVVASGVR
jgi:hypothetical protein